MSRRSNAGRRAVRRWRNVPLPEAHLAALALGVLLRFLLPWRVLPRAWIAQVIGWPLVVLGLMLAVWAVRAAGEADMERPDGVVVGGPYAISRNPMYLGWDLVLVGAAFVLNTAWLLVLLPPVLIVTHITILREERRLERLLGDRYLEYRARVRRYV